MGILSKVIEFFSPKKSKERQQKQTQQTQQQKIIQQTQQTARQSIFLPPSAGLKPTTTTTTTKPASTTQAQTQKPTETKPTTTTKATSSVLKNVGQVAEKALTTYYTASAKVSETAVKGLQKGSEAVDVFARYGGIAMGRRIKEEGIVPVLINPAPLFGTRESGYEIYKKEKAYQAQRELIAKQLAEEGKVIEAQAKQFELEKARFESRAKELELWRAQLEQQRAQVSTPEQIKSFNVDVERFNKEVGRFEVEYLLFQHRAEQFLKEQYQPFTEKVEKFQAMPISTLSERDIIWGWVGRTMGYGAIGALTSFSLGAAGVSATTKTTLGTTEKIISASLFAVPPVLGGWAGAKEFHAYGYDWKKGLIIGAASGTAISAASYAGFVTGQKQFVTSQQAQIKKIAEQTPLRFKAVEVVKGKEGLIVGEGIKKVKGTTYYTYFEQPFKIEKGGVVVSRSGRLAVSYTTQEKAYIDIFKVKSIATKFGKPYLVEYTKKGTFSFKIPGRGFVTAQKLTPVVKYEFDTKEFFEFFKGAEKTKTFIPTAKPLKLEGLEKQFSIGVSKEIPGTKIVKEIKGETIGTQVTQRYFRVAGASLEKTSPKIGKAFMLKEGEKTLIGYKYPFVGQIKSFEFKFFKPSEIVKPLKTAGTTGKTVVGTTTKVIQQSQQMQRIITNLASSTSQAITKTAVSRVAIKQIPLQTQIPLVKTSTIAKTQFRTTGPKLSTIPKISPLEKIKEEVKVTPAQHIESVVIPKPRQRVTVAPIPAQIQPQVQIPTQKPIQIPTLKVPKISTVPPAPVPPPITFPQIVPPSPITFFLPPTLPGGAFGSAFKELNLGRRLFKYQPSFAALPGVLKPEGIFGKKKKLITGLTIRPIIR